MKVTTLSIIIIAVLVVGIAVFLFNQMQTPLSPFEPTGEKVVEESEQPLPIEGWGELEKIIQVEGEEWPSFTLTRHIADEDKQLEELKKDIQIYGDKWNPVLVTFEVKVPDDWTRRYYDVFLLVKDYFEPMKGWNMRELPMKEVETNVWITKFRASENSEVLYRYNLEGIDAADEIVNGDENVWRSIEIGNKDISVHDEVKEWKLFIGGSSWNPYKPLDRIIESGVDTIRFANHEFIPVGETRDFDDIGDILEVMRFSDEEKIKLDSESHIVTCLKGGVACIRAQYREDSGVNDVQTKCIACIDETGSCKGEKPVSFDFEQFLDREGEANWLQSGDNLFYGVCEVDGKIRLQQSAKTLPRLYFVVSDCLGGGGACLDWYEHPWIRKGTITTFSGKNIKPNWIINNKVGIEKFSIDKNGEVVVIETSCNEGCSLEPTLVQDGDIFVTEGLAPNGFDDYIDKVEKENPERLQKLLERHGITKFKLSDLDAVDPGLKGTVVSRLINLEFNHFDLNYFDGTHRLREKNIIIALEAPSRSIECDNPLCQTVENELMKAEKTYIEKLKQEGFSPIWGSYRITEPSVSIWRPYFSTFDGVLLTPDIDALGETEEKALEKIPEVMEEISHELKKQAPDTPVVVRFWGIEEIGPLGGCEATYCPTSSYYTFAFGEKIISIFMKNLGEQFSGIGVGWFEGGHFDIRYPVEPKYGYFHNMVTNTGYNNPILNIYAAQ